MNVCLVLGIMGDGGHTRSAVAIGRSLMDIGHNVHFFGVDYNGRRLIENGQMAVTAVSNTFSWQVAKDQFEHFADKFIPDVVHCFDDRGLPIISRYARRCKTPVVLTICGGPVPRYAIPDMCPIVVFSEELKIGLQSRSKIPLEHIFVNSARIELGEAKVSEIDIRAYRDRLNLAEYPVVLLISRIDNTKTKAILHLIHTMLLLGEKSPARLLIVGKVYSQVAYRTVLDAVEDANLRLGGSFIVLTDDGAEQASRLLTIATIAVGIGRTAFEAMHKGIPTLVVGEHGFSGTATCNNFLRMAKFNFSGRDASDLPPKHRTPETTATEIIKLLANKEYACKVGEEGKRWVDENLDSKQGARFYDEIYRKPPSFFIVPSKNSISRLTRRFLFQKIYHAAIPSAVKDAIILLRKRYGNL